MKVLCILNREGEDRGGREGCRAEKKMSQGLLINYRGSSKEVNCYCIVYGDGDREGV